MKCQRRYSHLPSYSVVIALVAFPLAPKGVAGFSMDVAKIPVLVFVVLNI
jgi:uncharacterized membrane protein YtjA (UPF0391 family)